MTAVPRGPSTPCRAPRGSQALRMVIQMARAREEREADPSAPTNVRFWGYKADIANRRCHVR
jgi:hypothetical protein